MPDDETKSRDLSELPDVLSDYLLSFSPYLREYALIQIYSQYSRRPVPGIYAIPSRIDASKWNCLIFIRSGLFEGGVYKFRLDLENVFQPKRLGAINSNEKQCWPEISFSKPFPFHPRVDANTGRYEFPHLTQESLNTQLKSGDVLKMLEKVLTHLADEAFENFDCESECAANQKFEKLLRNYNSLADDNEKKQSELCVKINENKLICREVFLSSDKSPSSDTFNCSKFSLPEHEPTLKYLKFLGNKRRTRFNSK